MFSSILLFTSPLSGEFHQNNRHGFGVKIYADGDVYSGQWENDVKQGELSVFLVFVENVYISVFICHVIQDVIIKL